MVATIIPKVASSAILVAIIRIEYPDAPGDDDEAFKVGVHAYQGWVAPKSPSIIWGNYKRLLVLREPCQRIAASFINKFCEVVEAPIVNPILRDVGKSIEAITFRDVVQYLDRTPSSWLDPHFRPQVDSIFFRTYDVVVRFEDRVAVADAVRSLLGVEVELVNHWPVAPVPRGGLADVPVRELTALALASGRLRTDELLDESCTTVLRRRYRDDIAAYRLAGRQSPFQPAVD